MSTVGYFLELQDANRYKEAIHNYWTRCLNVGWDHLELNVLDFSSTVGHSVISHALYFYETVQFKPHKLVFYSRI